MKLHHKNKVSQNQKRKLYGKARKRKLPGPSGYHGRTINFEGTGMGSYMTPFYGNSQPYNPVDKG